MPSTMRFPAEGSASQDRVLIGDGAPETSPGAKKLLIQDGEQEQSEQSP
jgi:hypothetical protein